MQLGANAISLLFSLISALLALAFFSKFSEDFSSPFFYALGGVFLSTFVVMRIGLSTLFFREISKVYRHFTMVTFDKTIEDDETKDMVFFNATLKSLNDDISKYALSKQGEIEDLKRMETFRREFMADVSHELKTPIFSAQGFIHTLMDGAIDDKKVRTVFLKKAADSLDGLDVLVQDLLTISQMEAGEIKMNFFVFDLVKLTKRIFEQLEEKADERGVKLSIDKRHQGGSVLAYADNRRIEQVIRNLIVNGISYSREKNGKVEVGFEEKSNHIKVSVKDNGQGIAKEDQIRIFQRFFRVEKSRSRVQGGTGLGLSIVKHIIEAHDSTVNVSSEIGKGSVFSFSLARDENGLKKKNTK